jgi:uncharacterized membrane protein
MELSPEERRKIYEEEKARLEAREQLEQERRRMSSEMTLNMAPNVAGLLCYLLGWVTGIIFLVLEQKNKWVRYHAAQSIVVFGTLWVAGMILGWIPFIGAAFAVIIGLVGFILWIVLMVKAYNGERYKVAWAGDIAERIVVSSGTIPDYQKPPAPPERKEAPQPQPQPPSQPPPPSAGIDLDERINKRVNDFLKRRNRREGRITAYAFAIAWSIVLFVFFNFFYQYAAYYNADTTGGIVTWTRSPFFTSDIGLWLPILNTTLAISIIGHIVMIILDRNILRQALHVIIDGFVLATVITLLVVFPFDFNVIPNSVAAAGTNTGVTVVLICIAVGFGIGLLVRVIRLLVSIVRALVKSPDTV